MEFLTMAVDNVLVSAAESPMTPQSLASALKEMRPHDLSLPSQILDVINQYWTDQPADGRSRLGAFLKALIESGVVSTELAIELVDRNILQDSGIISNSQILNTRTVRINTGLLYKQQKFNLLREENEGYGKLSHEFNLALSELPKGGFVDSADLAAKSEELLTVVDALIGYFELDPNRVLDNILDICSQNLLSHARFILHFLHSSPWAPPSKSVSLPFTAVDKTEKRRRLDSMQQDFTGYYKTEMSRLGGSRLAAQLLGFKFRFFASTVDGDGKGNTSSPESLVFLTALLIKSGFIRLSDIYPYVRASEDKADY
jgi:THO complex subunit 2